MSFARQRFALSPGHGEGICRKVKISASNWSVKNRLGRSARPCLYRSDFRRTASQCRWLSRPRSPHARLLFGYARSNARRRSDRPCAAIGAGRDPANSLPVSALGGDSARPCSPLPLDAQPGAADASRRGIVLAAGKDGIRAFAIPTHRFQADVRERPVRSGWCPPHAVRAGSGPGCLIDLWARTKAAQPGRPAYFPRRVNAAPRARSAPK